MSGIVDFHSHILPGIDDGSASVEESVAMLQLEASQGIRKVVATPHFYPRHDEPEKFLARRAKAEMRLRQALGEHKDIPEIICGAEVYFFSGISDCDALPELTIEGKGYILIEMPPSPWTHQMYAELEEIRARWDIVPIIAHVDRYMSLLNTHGIPQRLEELPVLVQANAGFFLRAASRARALRMLENDQIQLLGSDCHNLTSRPPNLEKALQIIERHSMAEAVRRVESYQEQVLSGG